ncbi:MAG: CCA tRNA nucleotidyltransferase [Alphaproteobacteria bacterium]|nr:CCA tRNA nucleotidyltransferase [Alphaproteobacteria bacterium]
MSTEAMARERLGAAPWLRMAPLRAVFTALDAASGRTRVVGGAVRDTLLGRNAEAIEIDLATTLVPEEVTARAEAKGIAVIPTGIAFGTVTLTVAGTGFEVTTLRHDVETDGRRALVRFGTDWTEDARRRDFTLNALYCGPDGALFDPLGGLEDCLAGRVRFIGEAAARIAEDRLRVFRFFRFSASHGGERFDADGLSASTAAAGALGPLSAERIGHEMTRILGLRHCAKTLGTMAEAGLVDLDTGVIDALRHYERVAVTPALAGRLALLGGSDGQTQLQRRWRLSNALVKQARALHEAAGLIAAGKLAEAAYRQPAAGLAAVDIAGARAAWTREDCAGLRGRFALYKPPPFPITGALLVRHGFAAGPRLGTLLSHLESAWIDSDFTLTEAELLAMAAERS